MCACYRLPIPISSPVPGAAAGRTHGAESGRRAGQVQANEHPFDLILATGDLSQDHSPESYQRFASMMAAPWLAPSTGCPANHDDNP